MAVAILNRSVSKLVEETLQGVDFDEFFKEDEDKMPRKRVKKIVMDEDEEDPIVDDVVLSGERLLQEDPIDDDESTMHTVTFAGIQVVPHDDDNDGVLIFGSIPFLVQSWLIHHHSATYDFEQKCWTVTLCKGLSYSYFVFRLQHCTSRVMRTWTLRQATAFVERKYDEQEAAQTIANRRRYLEELAAEEAKQTGQMLYPIYNALCPCCGHDHFFEKVPNVTSSSCGGCHRAWDD